MLKEDSVILIKLWFSISKEEQAKRFEERKNNPLKQWKLSPVDLNAQEKWIDYTKYKELMFIKRHSSYAPWVIIKGDNKHNARLESIRYVLSHIDYEKKKESITNLKINIREKLVKKRLPNIKIFINLLIEFIYW
jgi:polyphosphate kinase 2 (PPK2 family)